MFARIDHELLLYFGEIRKWSPNCSLLGVVDMGTFQRQFCLDMLKVSWVGTDGFKKSDCAIILEIEPAGGLVQTTAAIPCSSEIALDIGLGFVQGHVTSCEE